jgi:nicotinate dehydrogenase subunit A
MPATFFLNGADCSSALPDDTPLLAVLREEQGLSGPRFGCGEGECGACMVLVDGRAVVSCNLPLWSVQGKQVTTVEGLGTPEHMHPVQAAFVEHDALQCGYCTPGMVMSTAALLKEKPNATEDDVRYAIRGNICRCGTYPKIFDAALAASRKGA